MIESGLEYSYIMTGEAFVFLRIDSDDTNALYYHVKVPNNEIDDNKISFMYPRTSISQVLSLCLMASQSTQRDHKWRKKMKGA
jgi:hypothetical protein